MKKLLGFGMLFALLGATVTMANAQNTTVNLFPFGFGTFQGLDMYLAVTNLTDTALVVGNPSSPTNPLTIRSTAQDGTLFIGLSDLNIGETRIFASNESVHPRNIGCVNNWCTVVVCAPLVVSQTGITYPAPPDPPAITSSLFWVNNDQFYALTTPIAFNSNGCATAFGVPPTNQPTPVAIP